MVMHFASSVVKQALTHILLLSIFPIQKEVSLRVIVISRWKEFDVRWIPVFRIEMKPEAFRVCISGKSSSDKNQF